MKSRFSRVVLLSALALTSPALILAAGQPKLHMLNQSQMQDLSGATPAVQQGKGSGLSRNEAPSANGYHLSTASELPAGLDETAVQRANWSDGAFRK